MKLFRYLCASAVILGCLGVSPSVAGASDIGSALLQSRKGIQTESAGSEGSSTQFQNVEGRLKEIQGNVYVVEGKTTHQSIRVEIGRDTAFPNGQKEPDALIIR